MQAAETSPVEHPATRPVTFGEAEAKEAGVHPFAPDDDEHRPALTAAEPRLPPSGARLAVPAAQNPCVQALNSLLPCLRGRSDDLPVICFTPTTTHKEALMSRTFHHNHNRMSTELVELRRASKASRAKRQSIRQHIELTSARRELRGSIVKGR